MADKKVATEVAEAEFERFADAMELDVDRTHMDDADKAAFLSNYRTFIQAVERGRLSVNDKGEPVYTPSSGDPLTFHEPEGADLMQSDGRKAGHDVKKFYTIMGAMTKTSALRFEKMANRDLKVCQSIALLFLG